MTSCQPEITSLSSLPPELFLSIFSHLPQRTTRTPISRLETIKRTSPSKQALENLSLTSSYLRDLCAPQLFEGFQFTSPTKLKEFIESGDLRRVGGFAKRVTMRWRTVGEILAVPEQQTATENRDLEEVTELVAEVFQHMPGLRSVNVDFPGAFKALERALSREGVLELVEYVNVRNGSWKFGLPFRGVVEGLAKSRKLKSLIIDGAEKGLNGPPRSWAAGLTLGREAFSNLVNLDIGGVSFIDDGMLRTIVGAAKKLTSLSVKGCSSITLSATRRLLISYGYKLQHLSLEIFKSLSIGHEQVHIDEDEHLCPVIHDYCGNLKILDLYTDKICKEVLFPTTDKIGGGTMTGGLPTPPGSPDLALTTVADIPTPPAEATTLGGEISAPMLPPPLLNFTGSSLEYNAWAEKDRKEQKREMMKSVSLRIPYDASCFGTASRGPSPQQSFTSLCDGLPAKELLEFGLKAFDEGLVEVVKIQGHWKGGPYLIIED